MAYKDLRDFLLAAEDYGELKEIKGVDWSLDMGSIAELVIERYHTSTRDPAVSMEEKRKYKVAPKPLYASKCLIDACQPFEWKPKDWYPVVRSSAEQCAKVFQKYGSVLKRLL